MLLSRQILKDDRSSIHSSRITYQTSLSRLKVTCYAIYNQKCYSRTREPLNCVIFLRGGNRDFSSLKPEMFTGKSLFTYLAHESFFVIAPQYPGVDGGEGTDGFGSSDDLDSITSLVNILKSREYKSIVNTTSIGIVGVSRGGMNAYQIMRMNPSWLKSVVVVAGPVDIKRGWKLRPEMKELARELYGATSEGARNRSATEWYREIPRIPLLVLHGGLDQRVDLQSVLVFVNKLSKSGYPFKLNVYGELDHFLLKPNSSFPIKEEIVNWLRLHL